MTATFQLLNFIKEGKAAQLSAVQPILSRMNFNPATSRPSQSVPIHIDALQAMRNVIRISSSLDAVQAQDGQAHGTHHSCQPIPAQCCRRPVKRTVYYAFRRRDDPAPVWEDEWDEMKGTRSTIIHKVVNLCRSRVGLESCERDILKRQIKAEETPEPTLTPLSFCVLRNPTLRYNWPESTSYSSQSISAGCS